MCSISGLFQTGWEKELAFLRGKSPQEVVEWMNSALRHRGPDDRGVATIDTHSRGKVVLGNTRLAIIDTSPAGHQPMHDPETGNWISYNGETYNFRELRREIGNEFGSWKSNTDTEVVLRAYRKWGVKAFEKLRGMFALAIWDAQERHLVLARDQFGIKPLYYCLANHSAKLMNVLDGGTSGAVLLFASEIRALLATKLVSAKLSPGAITSFLETGSVAAPLTIIRGVSALPPGGCLLVREKSNSISLERSQFSGWPTRGDSRPKSRAEAKARLRAILEDSVQRHLISDVPLGVFLSGGMDSSAIVALLSQFDAPPPRTFSVVFNEKKFNESQPAKQVAARFRTNHTEITLSEEKLLNLLPKALSSLDQPSMDGINTYVVSDAVKNAGITVALSGLGGDELFGGYPSFKRALRLDRTNRLTKTALRVVAPVGRFVFNGSAQRSKFWQLAESSGSPQDVYRITRQLFSPSAIKVLATTETEPSLAPTSAIESHDVVNTISKLELDGYMANTLLRDTDAMSMAHSLEVRVPFVDASVAGFILDLPGEWKIDITRSNTPKPLLSETISDLLPSEILHRNKMGFTLPFERWMTANLQDEINSVFNDSEQMLNSGVNQLQTQKIWHDFLRNPRAIGWSRPWSLYVLARWCSINDVTS